MKRLIAIIIAIASLALAAIFQSYNTSIVRNSSKTEDITPEEKIILKGEVDIPILE
jgi:hypothetical protein